MFRLLPLLILWATLLPAQHIGVGIKGGLPVIDATKLIDRNLTSIRKGDFVVGPMFELLLPAGLGVELNALYRRGNNVGSLEFPLLGKYRFPGIVVRPTISGGFVFQRLTDIPGLDNRKGIVAGGGVEIKLPKLRIGPELRYTRFNERRTSSGFLTGTNQVDILVGFSF
ncbi:MAG: hypothetical protein NTV52_22495 [Acidobacteria bacterium]|nr:hypothetical protein [Acidobacteriota bacterium]